MMGADTTTQSAPEDIMPIARRSTRSAAEKLMLVKRELHKLNARRGTIAALELKDGRPFEFFGRGTDPFTKGEVATVESYEGGTYVIRIKETGATWHISSRSFIYARTLTEQEADAVLWADSREREIDDVRTTFKGLEISNCLSAIAGTETDLNSGQLTAIERRQVAWRLEAFRGLLEDAKQAERDRIAAMSDEELDATQHQASVDAMEYKRRVESHHSDMKWWGKRSTENGRRNSIKYAQFAQTADFQREEACTTFDLTVIEKNRREEQARTDEIAEASFITPGLELARPDEGSLSCITMLNYLGESQGLSFATRTLARRLNSIIIKEWSVHRSLVRSSLILDHEFIRRIEEYSPYQMCRFLAKVEIIFASSGIALVGLDALWLERHKNVL